MIPRRSDFTAALARTFAVQGSWNYETMIGGGIAYAILPLLERIHSGDPVALRRATARHAGLFNSHPYLSSMAVGALARLEHDRESAETIERFRQTIGSPLGAIGDQAVWAGWRPLCLFGAVLAFAAGLDPRWCALGFLVVFNLGHVGIRVWAFRRGWRDGLRIGDTLNRSALKRSTRWLGWANPVLIGLAAGLLAYRLPGGIDATGAVLATGFGIGAYFLPVWAGRVSAALLAAALVLWWW